MYIILNFCPNKNKTILYIPLHKRPLRKAQKCKGQGDMPAFYRKINRVPNSICMKRGSVLYPYHNRIKQRIYAGELLRYEYVRDYPRIGEALVLYFSTHPPVRPIRPHRYAEYLPILARWDAGGYRQNTEDCDEKSKGGRF